MKKIKNSKGFTLMEMLIVVAIIAVLIAIAVPTFSSSLNKARVATDEANIRSGYASVVAELLTGDNVATAENKPKVYFLKKDGSVATADTGAYETLGNATNTGSGNIDIAGVSVERWTKGNKVTYSVTISTDGKYTIAISAGGTGNTNTGDNADAGKDGN